MLPTRFFYAIVVCFTSVAAVGGQASAGLSDDLRTHVQDERLQIVTSIRGLPLGVRGELGNLFGTQTLDIAEPGARFQESDPIEYSPLPTRRLVAAGCSYDHCLVYYERGGASRTWRAALFRWTPAATTFESGGAAPAGLKTIEDVRRVFLSGAIKDPGGSW